LGKDWENGKVNTLKTEMKDEEPAKIFNHETDEKHEKDHILSNRYAETEKGQTADATDL